MYTAKQVESDRGVELFTTKTVTTTDGKEVSVLESVGTYSVADLESDKDRLQEQIAEIDVKLAAIKSLK